jgi:hypothetical protein
MSHGSGPRNVRDQAAGLGQSGCGGGRCCSYLCAGLLATGEIGRWLLWARTEGQSRGTVDPPVVAIAGLLRQLRMRALELEPCYGIEP